MHDSTTAPHCTRVGALLLAAAALVGCAKEPKPAGPMERLGEKVDRAAKKTVDAATAAADAAAEELAEDKE